MILILKFKKYCQRSTTTSKNDLFTYCLHIRKKVANVKSSNFWLAQPNGTNFFLLEAELNGAKNCQISCFTASPSKNGNVKREVRFRA